MRHRASDYVETPPYNEEDPNADLYVQDLPPSLTERVSVITINDNANVTSDATVMPDDQMDVDPGSPIGTPSPPFEPPASWAAIDTAHAERIAQERASDIRRAREQEVQRLEESLLYRRVVINAAKANTAGNQRCILPEPWHMKGLLGDLVRHPYQLEEYLDQEMEIRSLLLEYTTCVEQRGNSSNSRLAFLESKYLKEQMELRWQIDDAGEIKRVIGDLLTIKLDQVISDISNKVDKRPGTTPISTIPASIRRVVDLDDDLSGQLATLIEVESEAFPWLFEEETPATSTQQSPTQEPEHSPRVSLNKLAPPPAEVSPERSHRPLPSFFDFMPITNKRQQEEKVASVRGKPCVCGTLPSELRKEICACPELGQRIEDVRVISPCISCQHMPPLDVMVDYIVYMSRYSHLAPEKGPDELDDGQTPSPPQQQAAVPEATPRTRTPDQSHLARGAPAPAQPSTPPSQRVRASPLGVASPETAPSTARSKTTETSVHKSSSVTPTLFISAAASATNMANAPNTPNAPNGPRTPTPTPQGVNPMQGLGPTPTRLMHRLELESQRSNEGVVQQVRFADRELLPGETPGESSTSRVNDWLDREDNAARNLDASGAYWMRDAPGTQRGPRSGAESQPEPQPEQHVEVESQPQPEQHRGEASDTQNQETGDDQELKDALTEEEKELRRDSAYKSRQASLANPRGRGG